MKRRSAASVGKALRQLTPEIKTHIAERLAVHTSPEVISGELRNTKGISPSKNTIYRYIPQDKYDGRTKQPIGCKSGSVTLAIVENS